MSLVANRYSEALFSLALDKNAVETYKNDLDNIKNIFNSIDNLNAFFVSEKISKDDKKNLIKNAFDKNVNKDILNFLYLLVDKGRIINYEEIIKEYKTLANDNLNIKEGIIESARPLDANKVKELEKALSKNGENVELTQRINKSLISGFKITFENKVIDASMKEKINKLNEMLNRKDV